MSKYPEKERNKSLERRFLRCKNYSTKNRDSDRDKLLLIEQQQQNEVSRRDDGDHTQSLLPSFFLLLTKWTMTQSWDEISWQIHRKENERLEKSQVIHADIDVMLEMVMQLITYCFSTNRKRSSSFTSQYHCCVAI